MAKRGYKQGAMSATDAVTQLKAAAAKCDDKWMKAHAASARFFGAREADVRKALSKCGTIKSSLMGTKPRRRKRGVGMFDQVASKLKPGDERDFTVTIERGYKGFAEDEDEGLRGLQGTTAQHMEAGLEYLSLARGILARAEATPAYTEKRQDEALKALHYATEAVGECGWAPQEGLVCRREGRELVERATRLVKKRVESTGRGVRGLKGSSPQHFERAKGHFSAADSELEWAEGPVVRAYGGQKRVLANASRQLTAGMVNCTWVRTKKAKQVCYAEEKRLIRKLAKLEGDDPVHTYNFALDGTRKKPRRRRKR